MVSFSQSFIITSLLHLIIVKLYRIPLQSFISSLNIILYRILLQSFISSLNIILYRILLQSFISSLSRFDILGQPFSIFPSPFQHRVRRDNAISPLIRA